MTDTSTDAPAPGGDQKITTIPEWLQTNGRAMGDKVAYAHRFSGTWRTTNWSMFDMETRRAAKAMMNRGIGQGDVVTILSNNRPEWTITAIGAMRAAAAGAGIYGTSSAEEILYVINHAKSRLLVVEDADQLTKVLAVWDQMPVLEHIVVMAGTSVRAITDNPAVSEWVDFMGSGRDVSDDDADARLASITADDVASLIYTSGTTGPPKAVMLTHRNIAWTASMLGESLEANSADVVLSYLPLSHIAEQMLSVHMAITKGFAVYYCHDGLRLAEFLPEVRPTIFFGVPRVWERFHSALVSGLSEATGTRKRIADWALGVGTAVVEAQAKGDDPGHVLTAQFQLADRLVFSKIRERVGLDRARRLGSGAAPIPEATLRFFYSIGMPILEIYGQSEDSGPTTANLPGATRIGSVGRPLPGVEVKLDETGEVLVRGKNVFAGYLHDPDATAATMTDDWLRSGDLGSFDEDGFLHITGRAKDIIITSGGKNIAPANIEQSLMEIPLVSQAVVVGEQQRYLIALLTLDPEASATVAQELGVGVEELATNATVRQQLGQEISEKVNARYARVEHVRNFTILDHELTIDDGDLTPTMKIKRNVVVEKNAKAIVETYAAGQILD